MHYAQGKAEAMRRRTTPAIKGHRGVIGVVVITVLAVIVAAVALFEAGADSATVSLFAIGACSFAFGLMRPPRSRD